MAELELGDLTVTVEQKNIKHVHLSVHPPEGRVMLAAPAHMDLDILRLYTLKKLPWIREQQRQFAAQPREQPRQYVEREDHYYRGQRYLLRIEERPGPAQVQVHPGYLLLRVRPGTTPVQRGVVLEAWYREQLRTTAQHLVTQWAPRLGVEVAFMGIKRMKTLWGSCQPARGRIWLNLELAKKPFDCLEYILVHELVHLLEPQHTPRFTQLMDTHLPAWQQRRQLLNQLPLAHREWGY